MEALLDHVRSQLRAVFAGRSVILAGGVAANSELRAKFTAQSPVKVYFPALSLCTDNAAMVAAAAHFCGSPVGLDASVYSRQR